MTHLYTCRSAGDQYRITKLTANLDIESSYLCSADECQCPGFERRGRCRHLEMLPRFIHRGHIGDGWALDFDRLGWEQIDAKGGGLPIEADLYGISPAIINDLPIVRDENDRKRAELAAYERVQPFQRRF